MIAIQKIGIVNSVIRLPIDSIVDVKFGSKDVGRDQMGAVYDCWNFVKSQQLKVARVL